MQEMFDFGPQVGQIWVMFSSIVMITDVGGEDFMGRKLPNLIRYIPIGQVKPHGNGAYWREDLMHPAGGTYLGDASEDRHRCDKIYFKPWDGRGVFFCSKEAEQIEKLKARQIDQKTRKISSCYWECEEMIEKIFAKRIAPQGFQ